MQVIYERCCGLDVHKRTIQLLGQILDRGRAATPSHVVGKALGIKGIAGQEVEPLALHGAAALALNPPNLEFQVHASVAAGQIARSPSPPVVPPGLHAPAAAAGRFFERRTRVMTQAFGSPKTPRTVGCGRKPGKAYAPVSRRIRFAAMAIEA